MLEEIKAELKKLDDAVIVDLTKAIAELKRGDAEAKKLASWPAKVWAWWEDYGWLVAAIETAAFIVWIAIRH